MALVNHSKREINVKVVYTGMPHAGKSTNLAIIHQRLKPEFRGQSRTIPMGNCTMQLCEFLPPGGGAIPGFALRFHLYTLADADVGDPQWRMVLKGADGIVFVADADPTKCDANKHAFAELLGQMNSLGTDLSQVPIIVQANFQDHSGALDGPGFLDLLAVPGITVLPATAVRGSGVLETLAAVVRKVTVILQRQGIVPLEQEDEETTAPEEGSADGELSAAVAATAVTPAPPQPGESDVEQVDEFPSSVASLATDGVPLEIPLRLSVGGVERQFILSVMIREAGALQCEPLRGAGYVR